MPKEARNYNDVKSAKRRSSRSSLSENNHSEENSDSQHQSTLELDETLRNKLVDMPEVLEFIEKLQRIIKKQVKKIIKWKMKVKQLSEKKNHVSTQTTNEDLNCMRKSGDKEVIDLTNAEEKSLTESIKEAAEQAVHSSGFVYEETSGLYYDYNSGYYYNAEYGLYYDGTSGTYLTYNQETQTYDFHSQVSTNDDGGVVARKSKRKNVKAKKAKGTKRRKTQSDEDQEDGECSDSSLGSISGGEDSPGSESSDIYKRWPPCMRLIVESTEIPKIKIGSLFVVTCDGGTLGREGGRHSVCLPDVNVSKHHLKIEYEKEASRYTIVDLGSRNGTFLNGRRISGSKRESEPVEVPHGSKIQVGSTVLLCHVHEGSQTCGHCEPGLLIEEETDQPLPRIKKNASQQFKSELRRLKKHHGLLGSASDESVTVAEGYTDRAEKRRNEVGSQNPYEKTRAASVDESIPSENKGFKLLSKMGWKEGDSLGKGNTGLKQPIPLVSNAGTSGIGAPAPITVSAPAVAKASIWKKAQERFDVLPDKSDIFRDDGDDDN